jgi:hypothetical protein
MTITCRAMPFAKLATAACAVVATIRCGGSSSPTMATTTSLAVSGVALNGASVAAGNGVQGTVSLTVAAPAGGASIAMSSSNSTVATVQTPVLVPAGSTTATFAVTAVAAGTATITASLNGSSSHSPTLTVTAAVQLTLSSISLSATSVVGGNPVTGTVTLTAAAPAGGAMVSLSGADPVTVPAIVMVAAGSPSGTFTISTRAVGGTIVSTIGASYGGVSASALLSVTRPTVATAVFGVSGPTETDTCTLTNGGNTLDCTFDGRPSSAPGNIVEWDWTYGVATMFAQTTSGPQLTMPTVTCALVPPPPLPAAGWFIMTVTLRIHDDLGNTSPLATDSGVRLLPQGVCGF